MTTFAGKEVAAAAKAQDDLSFFEPRALDRLMGLVMELAAQLNQERYRRIALEELLARRAIIEPGGIDNLGNDDQVVESARQELRVAIGRLCTPVVEHGHSWRPLREEDPNYDPLAALAQESSPEDINQPEER